MNSKFFKPLISRIPYKTSYSSLPVLSLGMFGCTLFLSFTQKGQEMTRKAKIDYVQAYRHLKHANISATLKSMKNYLTTLLGAEVPLTTLLSLVSSGYILRNFEKAFGARFILLFLLGNFAANLFRSVVTFSQDNSTSYPLSLFFSSAGLLINGIVIQNTLLFFGAFLLYIYYSNYLRDYSPEITTSLLLSIYLKRQMIVI